MKKLNRLPEAELTVMRAVWRLEPPVPTGAIRARLEKERPWNLSGPSDPAGPADRAGLPVRGEGGAAERLYPPGGRRGSIWRLRAPPSWRGGDCPA